jgi:hypothetical protein
MRSAILVLLVGTFALGVFALPGFASAENQPNWRYVWHNGQWWYWLPQGCWVYWNGQHWTDYRPVPPPSQSYVVQRPIIPTDNVDDIWPFYGHAVSAYGYRDIGPRNNRIGPFSGKAIPLFGPVITTPNEEIGPFYGHAP